VKLTEFSETNFHSPRLSKLTVENQKLIHMKKTFLKITALGLFAAAVVATPAIAFGQDATNAPATSDQAAPVKKNKKSGALAFNGKVSAVDTNAMTFTVGKHTFDVTSETKITKEGQPATLADATVGETASGTYKKGADGKLTAATVSYSTKATTKKKKKTAAGSSTNSVPN
jgi:hypothetical protein